ncbi:hypothetical protein [Streptomyces sp. NPDC088135]|uniref:hypothetical protein n=1 Tax=Streptomyces sp. NPDC088135 TaxID=3160993 RepID=UPI003423EA1F
MARVFYTGKKSAVRVRRVARSSRRTGRTRDGRAGAHIEAGKVIKTTKGSSADMSVKYKETARGGLAVNIIEC